MAVHQEAEKQQAVDNSRKPVQQYREGAASKMPPNVLWMSEGKGKTEEDSLLESKQKTISVDTPPNEQESGIKPIIKISNGATLTFPPEIMQRYNQLNSKDTTQKDSFIKIHTKVVLNTIGGIKAGGQADLAIKKGKNGLVLAPSKIRLVVTGGLNTPDIEEVLSEYHLSNQVDAGASITLHLDESGLNKIDLEAKGGISNKKRRLGRISFTGQAKLNPFLLLGTLHATTEAKFDLASTKHFSSSLMEGSQFFISVDESGISNVDSSLGFEFSRNKAAFASLSLAGMRPRGKALSLNTQLNLLKRIELFKAEEGGFSLAILPTTGLEATLTEGALTGINGALEVELSDKNGALLGGTLNGNLLIKDDGISLDSGSAKVDLLRDIVLQLGEEKTVTITQDTSVNAKFEQGSLTSIGGQFLANYNDGNQEIGISISEVDYDPNKKVIRSLNAQLSTDIDFFLFNNQMHVYELGCGLKVKDNKLTYLGGNAKLKVCAGNFQLDGEGEIFWENQGAKDVIGGNVFLDFNWQKEGDEHKFINGRLEGSINGDKFSLKAESINIGLMEGLTGKVSAEIDEKIDPILSGSINYSHTILQGSELFASEFEIGICLPVFPLVFIEAGILFGIGLNTQPLLVFGTAGIENWKPLSEESPNFHAQLNASWGIDLEAKVMAFLALKLGIPIVLSLSGGVRAGVGLNIPISISPYISLHSRENETWGEIGFDLSVTPILRLLIDAFIQWEVISVWDDEMVWPLLEQQLGDLGKFDWNGSAAFGDREKPIENKSPKHAVKPNGSPIPTPTGLKKGSSLGIGNKPKDSNSTSGLAGLTDGLTIPDSDNQDKDTSGLAAQFEKIGTYSNGIGAIGDLIDIVYDGFKAFVFRGPVGLILWFLEEAPSMSEIKAKQKEIEKVRSNLGDIIGPNSLINRVLGILSGEYGFWAIVDASTPYQVMVEKGLHREVSILERAEICKGLIRGWTGESDEAALIKILEYTYYNEGKAAVRELANNSGGWSKWSDQFESWFGQDEEEREILNKIMFEVFVIDAINSSTTYTPKPGAKVDRDKRSSEDLAKTAYGHESYSIYIDAMEWNQYFEDTVQLPTSEQMQQLAQTKTNKIRLSVPGQIDYAHKFETFDFLAEVAYGNKSLAWRIQEANPSIELTEETKKIRIRTRSEHGFFSISTYEEITNSIMKEGSQITLPSADKLGPVELQIEPTPVGSTGYTINFDTEASRIFLTPSDQSVGLLAYRAKQTEKGHDAGKTLQNTLRFSDEPTELEIQNAIIKAAGLLDFLISSKIIDPNNIESVGVEEHFEWIGKTIGEAASSIYGFMSALIPNNSAKQESHDEEFSLMDWINDFISGNPDVPMEKDKQEVGKIDNISSLDIDKKPTLDNGQALKPDTETTIKEGDTWSSLAIDAYDDFKLFVKLSKHPRNAAIKTLPVGETVYLPTKKELESVPEFGLGLSPTGNPLLTEMVRIPTNDELHHIWAEDRGKGKENAVWMMASSPEDFSIVIAVWKKEFEGNKEMMKAIKSVETILDAEISSSSVDKRKEEIQAIENAEPTNSSKYKGLTPIVGPHKVKKISNEDIKRESHHLPANELSKTLAEFYKDVGLKLQAAGYTDLAKKYKTRANKIASDFPDGNNLSAIRISKEAHNKKETGFHNIPTAESLKSIIEGENIEITLLYDSEMTKIYANMGEIQWKAFIGGIFSHTYNEKIMQIEENGNVKKIRMSQEASQDAFDNISQKMVELSHNNDGDDDQIKSMVNTTAKNTYKEALKLDLGRLTLALINAKSDGDPDEHLQTIEKLRDKADEIWEEKIVKPI